MLRRFRQVLKVTAVRLSLLYTLLFGALAVGLLFYVSHNTSSLIISQIRTSAEEEVRELDQIYRIGGARSLIRNIERRARNPGSNLYLVSDASGRIITGNVKNVAAKHLTRGGWSAAPFDYEPFDNNRAGPHRAIAQVFDLPGGLRLLVGRDVGDAVQFRGIVAHAVTIALLLMLATGLALWFFIGRRALRRIDEVSTSSARIMSGDLSGRLPVTGAGDEFDRLAQSLNGLIARIETLNDGVRTVSDSIAHDLKTPLTRLKNRAETALTEGNLRSKTARSALTGIVDEADGLIRTFDALLMISQVQSGAHPAKFDTLDLKSFLETMQELYELPAEEANVRLSLHAQEPVWINANRELLAQAIINLLDNALKYGVGHDQPEILMHLETRDGFAIIDVRDNGAGIAEGDRDRVLERFVRGDTSRSQPGTGLGLSLVDALVSLHGGRLVLRDNAPGLVARVTLPLPS